MSDFDTYYCMWIGYAVAVASSLLVVCGIAALVMNLVYWQARKVCSACGR